MNHNGPSGFSTYSLKLPFPITLLAYPGPMQRIAQRVMVVDSVAAGLAEIVAPLGINRQHLPFHITVKTLPSYCM